MGVSDKGAVAILFGLAALLRPDIALAALILLFGAYALVDGVFAIVGVFGGNQEWYAALAPAPRGSSRHPGWHNRLRQPRAHAIAALYLVAAWAVVTGIAEIATAIRLRQEMTGEWALILGGILSVIFGLLLAVLPGVGILSLIWLIGIYAIVFGVLMLIAAPGAWPGQPERREPRRVT